MIVRWTVEIEGDNEATLTIHERTDIHAPDTTTPPLNVAAIAREAWAGMLRDIDRLIEEGERSDEPEPHPPLEALDPRDVGY